jgi:hypothetical protein
LTLDVFLESGEAFDREATEASLARSGIPSDSVVATADGGEASVAVDDDGCVFVVRSLTPELASAIFEVARGAGLAILPADGTPTALVVGEASIPDELEGIDVANAEALYEALRHSEGFHAARSS